MQQIIEFAKTNSRDCNLRNVESSNWIWITALLEPYPEHFRYVCSICEARNTPSVSIRPPLVDVRVLLVDPFKQSLALGQCPRCDSIYWWQEPLSQTFGPLIESLSIEVDELEHRGGDVEIVKNMRRVLKKCITQIDQPLVELKILKTGGSL